MTINFDHKTPIYHQVARIIRDAVAAGDLPEGEAIPSVRQVSAEQGLNPQTVLNATRMLIDEGILEKRRGIGIFVKKGARKTLLGQGLKRFEATDVPALVHRARLLGLSRKVTLDLVKEKFEE
ncbi:MAG: GntR family transcriptional regulator [Fidelibacterota bacterium]|nr:MAG: GntR family transcriptional regulator [Candidatus Neomarinimicrobiota bacterium]